MEQVVIAAGARTPFGDFGGSLKDITMTDLAVHAAKAAIARSALEPADFDHLVFGSTMMPDRDSSFAARVVGVKAGLPEEVPALGVVRACGTGLQSILTAAAQIQTGHSQIALAGGAESFSRVPYAVTTARWGYKRGPQVLEDQLDWLYRCPFSSEYMGDTAENIAEDFEYHREAMDEWALMSQQRAHAAIDGGFLSRQIAPIGVPERGGERLFVHDEFPRAGTTMEKLAKLRPAFRPGGRVTAGNSSGITDGSAFVVVASETSAQARGLEARARLVDWTCVGVPPRIMGIGPVPAISCLLKRNSLSVGDIDYFEVNEAFAVVNLHAERELGIPRDKTNLYGGGISIGHPPGATGVRMTITAIQHLSETGGRYAVVSMCLGAGQGMAALLEAC
jgi:acetyl-CoA C-acetyltransferase